MSVEAIPDHETVLDRCRKLVPGLAERAMLGERLRRLPEETITAARGADLFRMVLPTELGGHGLGLRTLAEATRLLSRGDASSGWTLSFLIMHNWFLAKLGPAVRQELFGAGEPVLAPAPLAPSGLATPHGEGWRVTGRWEWTTGIAHADWVIVHAVFESGRDEPDLRFCVLPRDEVTAVDDVWHTSGMRGTGSAAVVLEDVFVPEHRTADSLSMRDGGTGQDFIAYPMIPVLALVASSVALGAAEQAMELFCARMADRVLAYSLGEQQKDQPVAQARLASVTATLRSAQAYWSSAVDQLVAAVSSPGGAALRDRGAARLAAAHTVRLAREVIGEACAASGASIYFETSPLQRIQRDVEVLKGHVIFDWDRTAELVGRLELGGQPRLADMI